MIQYVKTCPREDRLKELGIFLVWWKAATSHGWISLFYLHIAKHLNQMIRAHPSTFTILLIFYNWKLENASFSRIIAKDWTRTKKPIFITYKLESKKPKTRTISAQTQMQSYACLMSPNKSRSHAHMVLRVLLQSRLFDTIYFYQISP